MLNWHNKWSPFEARLIKCLLNDVAKALVVDAARSKGRFKSEIKGFLMFYFIFLVNIEFFL